ncbi:precorrin-3B C(17)-methyltransferase [Aurantimonas sp. Leaf443]|uniref:precorrin-3B C(17)-methyltransferase n=1 Tax=Aurantimonas sp. Leaf443 TaxID=1736378 RepID=UPI0006F4DA0F|nr:precorrin-3B C(17)-methyltransferase [Aurantimonas sp. Leaf443]KQT83087.1 precorrin-3B methylase [Aurantimonas sp. Leaf443]
MSERLAAVPSAPAPAATGAVPAIVVLTPGALPLARRVQAAIGGEVHGARARVEGADAHFESAAAHLPHLFLAGRPVVALMAAGAVVRILGPHLGDKRREPPVLSLAEDGSVAVPLLGGHRGANDLARRLAEALGCVAAVTTAGDLKFGLALDAPPAGYALENPEAAPAVMAELVAGAEVWIEGEAAWLQAGDLPVADDARLVLAVSEEDRAAGAQELLYRPKTLLLGLGAERGAPPEDAVALAETVLAEAKMSRLSIAAVASLDVKADEPAVHAVAAHFGVPARFFDAATLEAEAPRLENPSALVFAEVGCHGVAEGAALAGVGPDGALVVPKRKGARVTAALARAPRPLDPAAFGRARGRLFVVGIGPGCEGWRSPEVTAMIATATDLVGYSLYLDLLGPLAAGKVRHDFDLGAEEKRVRHAMELAGTGRDVALVCSGDAGIYAMATLVFELLEKGGLRDGARRIEICVSPGISALQGAAARAGAPLGHDFCTISLSDLLTPADDIARRVRAAGEADFVIAFYNPVSRTRRTQLGLARDELLRHRPAETPVILAANLGRSGESLRIVTLATLRTEDVDMLTTVVVGSSQSRVVTTGEGRRFVYTPRGYARKEGTGIVPEAQP